MIARVAESARASPRETSTLVYRNTDSKEITVRRLKLSSHTPPADRSLRRLKYTITRTTATRYDIWGWAVLLCKRVLFILEGKRETDGAGLKEFRRNASRNGIVIMGTVNVLCNNKARNKQIKYSWYFHVRYAFQDKCTRGLKQTTLYSFTGNDYSRIRITGLSLTDF